MTEVVEVELEDGRSELVDVVDTIDALTKKKMMEILNVKTRIDSQGEQTHEIEDSASKSLELMDLLCKRALRESDVSHKDLSESSKIEVAQVLQEDLEEMGMKIDKKKPG